MSLPLFDTHAHLNSKDFEGSVDEVVARAKSAGVVGINVIGIDAATSRRACDLAAEYPGYLYATVGIQPNSVATSTAEDWTVIQDLVGYAGVRAVGETGIDCYWDDTPLDQQRTMFREHIDLALAVALPIVIHMRESGDEIIEVLRSYPRLPGGVMHSFTGDAALAKRCLDLGLSISFAGMVTFKNGGDLREVAKLVPLDRLLIETDAPYLSPEPLRGKRPNEPARVEHTLRCLATVLNQTPETLAAITTANAKRFLQLP